ncbi:MAG TPA: hypothetical protein DHU81_16765 [Hyphomonas sp.]|nr:hypothetical protein [Hyphomonas sp.]
MFLPGSPAPGFLRRTKGRKPKETLMAKGQKKSNKEIRKPKAEKPKTNASNPTLKADSMLGVEKKKR